MKVVNLVVADAFVQSPQACVPRPTTAARADVRSFDFAFEPAQCSNRLAKWLAENIPSTRADDDRSTVWVRLPVTIEATHFRELGKKLSLVNPTSLAQVQAIIDDMCAWAIGRQSAYESGSTDLFSDNFIQFEWPELGSPAANRVVDPAEYFDLCARRIRALHPKSVILFNGSICPTEILM